MEYYHNILQILLLYYCFGSWDAIQHRGEQSLRKEIVKISSQRSALRDAGYIFQVAHHVHKKAEIASPRHPSHCKAIRQQILQYSLVLNASILYCSSAA